MSSSQQLHSLEQFLAQAQGPSVSWADVDDDPELYAPLDEPTLEPVEEVPRSSRHPVPNLPKSPPFVVYCGNLPYNCTEQHLNEFFAPLKPIEVRIIVDPSTKRGKGFGYVEFQTRDDMEQAFERNAQMLMNRPIRIDVQTNRENAYDRPQRHHSTVVPAVPAERPKLVLKPRTVDSNKPSSSTLTQKANPFGSARPREEVLKDKASAIPTLVEDQKSANNKRSQSPAARSKAGPAPIQQKPAWGPIRSVLSTQATDTSKEPQGQKEQQQRPAWGPRRTTLRADSEQDNEERLSRPADHHEPRSNRHADHREARSTRPADHHEPRSSRPADHHEPRSSRAADHHEPRSSRPADHHGARSARHTDHNEQRSARPNSSYRDHPCDSRPQGSTGSRPITPHAVDHERKGPNRHHDRPGPRLQNGGDRKVTPRNSAGDHRLRHRHDDRRSSREMPANESEPIAEAAEQATVSKPSPSERARSHSPLHADDSGFEVQRKGRRNGSGRNGAALSSTLSKINHNNRKGKGTDKSSGRQQAPVPDVPSSVAFSSNIFSVFADEDNDD